MGETFASRVGASLLTACNLPELITRTPQEYLSRAQELAHDPEQLGAIRRKLQATRLAVPLFDTERFTRHLETAYDLAWERFTQGLPPDHIAVPPLNAGRGCSAQN
jgi:predicted O-linked N-acetylglucosamine transferase (SPINDLY family)